MGQRPWNNSSATSLMSHLTTTTKLPKFFRCSKNSRKQNERRFYALKKDLQMFLHD